MIETSIRIDADKPENAIAVALCTDSRKRDQVWEHLNELEFLAETAGAIVQEKVVQERPRADVGTVIGRGKVQELKEIIEEHEASLVIFDDDLTPAQARNLEKALEVKVLDRSGIILDIFAARARSSEARVQVELAQLEYLLPRLSRMWTHLSKQWGGVGTKGPGETQIETDRRIVRNRITQLKQRLEKVAVQKQTQRKGRENLKRFALAGYTNAGKSTLMNRLTDSGVLVENKLFATLDTTVRKIALPEGREVLLSDTVGFIRKLPAHLVASFRSTLAEIIEADVILHVIDVSHPLFDEHMESVDKTLKSLGADAIPTLLVFNKIDALEFDEDLSELRAQYPDACFVSAAKDIGIDELLNTMTELCDMGTSTLEYFFPWSAAGETSQIYGVGDVLKREDKDDGIYITARIDNKDKHIASERVLTVN